MDVKDFYYDLPQELIAQDPLEDRSSSRLMVLDKATGEVEHRHFKDIVDYLRPGDCLVINNTKVIPARLYGVKEGTEAKIEILLLKRKENDVWETLVKPGKKCKIGTRINFGEGLLTGELCRDKLMGPTSVEKIFSFDHTTFKRICEKDQTITVTSFFK